MNKYHINYLHRLMTNEHAIGADLVALSNFFIVNMPEDMNIDVTDVVSFEFVDKKKCRIIIRDNYSRFPIFTINEYIDDRRKFRFFWQQKNDNIVVEHLDKSGKVHYTSTLEDIIIDRVKENKLSYMDDSVHTITLDISFNKRILNRNGSTNKE